jgi:hypothetical protein
MQTTCISFARDCRAAYAWMTSTLRLHTFAIQMVRPEKLIPAWALKTMTMLCRSAAIVTGGLKASIWVTSRLTGKGSASILRLCRASFGSIQAMPRRASESSGDGGGDERKGMGDFRATRSLYGLVAYARGSNCMAYLWHAPF